MVLNGKSKALALFLVIVIVAMVGGIIIVLQLVNAVESARLEPF
jgi:hypothetical protein